MSVFVRDRTFAARALTVLYEGGGWVKWNMRGRSARPLCGTWSSRRAEYSKLIVYGNRSPSSTAAPVLAIIPASARYAGPALLLEEATPPWWVQRDGERDGGLPGQEA